MPTSACELEPDRPETLPGNRESDAAPCRWTHPARWRLSRSAKWSRHGGAASDRSLKSSWSGIPSSAKTPPSAWFTRKCAFARKPGLQSTTKKSSAGFPIGGRARATARLPEDLRDESPGPAFPHEGEVLAGFRLVRELGRGAAGRVFLAVQPSLADRPVVLKITSRGRGEHLSLARLQHMNIVPLYSEHVLQARDLQILCMPFLGGATLGQVLELIRDEPRLAVRARRLLEALDQIEARLPFAPHAAEPLRNFIARCSYVEAICESARVSPTVCSTPTTAISCTWT